MNKQRAERKPVGSSGARYPMTIRRVWGCHMPHFLQIHSTLWPFIKNKVTDRQTEMFGSYRAALR